MIFPDFLREAKQSCTEGYKSLPNLAVFVIFLILAKMTFFFAHSTHTGHTEAWFGICILDRIAVTVDEKDMGHF
jgi:hypothetical protein